MVDNHTTDGRLELLERRNDELERRLAALEREHAPAASVLPRPPVTPPFAPAVERLARTRPPLEDLVAGRALAWAGGVTVLVGIVLLVAVAVSRGWIGEGTRTLLGGLLSFTLATAGCWLHERHGRTDASLAALGAGVAGLFATVVVATRVYALIPESAGLALVLVVGAAATALAIRWRTELVAALGLLGGLAAPVLVGAPHDGPTTALLAITAAAAAAVCVARRWDWLGLSAFTVTTPQWLAFVLHGPADAAAVATLAGFGALAIAAALGPELRTAGPAVARARSIALLGLEALVLAGTGADRLAHPGVFLWALAAVHLALAAALTRTRRASCALALAATVIAALLVDAALASTLHGVAVTVGWVVVAALLGPATRDARTGRIAGLALLALPMVHALVDEAPATALGHGVGDLPGTAVALVTIALAACSLRAWAVSAVVALDLASIALVTAVGPGAEAQTLLSALWGVAGVAALVAGLLRDVAALRTGALVLLAATLAKVFAYDLQALTALARVASFLALGLLLLGGAYAWERVRPGRDDDASLGSP